MTTPGPLVTANKIMVKIQANTKMIVMMVQVLLLLLFVVVVVVVVVVAVIDGAVVVVVLDAVAVVGIPIMLYLSR